MADHNTLGKEGEDAAVNYLLQEGYQIRHRNWRFRRKELDIVAEKDGELIVIEVKTRRNEEFGSPEDAINARKIRNIISSTDAYLKKFQLDLPVRFDIITLVGEQPPFKIEHIKEAFLPPIW
ncbi:YraN family protein [uncultured Bacteroides sp.]|uniref:YraN family protein n=1 Tax=uncultured Bacteroides sp. TaxID=162156 RepID=UPI0026172191|nr:YraN family protein [uncultured Bacteroides sp.]